MKFLGLFPVVAISSSLALSGVQQAMASDDRPPADFLLEMIDPSLCLVPPADMSDAEIIAMLDSDDPEMAPPVSGTWRQGGAWQVAGQGNFNHGSNGLVASTELVLRHGDDRLRFLCLGLARHVDTYMTEGQADLVVALVGDRHDGAFVAEQELITERGTLSLTRVDKQAMTGSLTLEGRLEGQAPEAAVTLELDLTELWHHDGMRVVDWDNE